MAGEQKGKAYEAFTKAALLRLKGKRVFKGDIFWDEKAEGMTIVPDLTIGTDKDHIHTLILITHSGSAKESEKKGWRNMGELAEAKIFLPVVPKVFNLAFDSVIKENLKKAQAASFDGQLLVGDKKYGDKLQQWIDHNLKRFPKDKHEKADFITEEARTDKVLKSLLDQFATDLEALLKKKAPVELEQVWAMERKRAPGRAPRARDTFVRRGLSKLLIFEDLDVAIRLFSGKRVTANEVPEYAYELGLANRFTSGGSGIAKPADEEIVNAVTTLGDPLTKMVLRKAPVSEISAWLVSLRNITDLAIMGDYIEKNFSTLSSMNGLKTALRSLHRDSGALIPATTFAGGSPDSVWMFEVLMELVKQSEDKSAGFGYAQLGREVVAAGWGSSKDLASASQFGGGFGLSAWIKRNPKSGFRDDLLEGCADVLSARLKTIGLKSVQILLNGIKDGFASNLIESKICTYKGFEPLRLLIESVVPGCKLDKIRSCFGEKAALPGQATKTTILRKGKTLINWQSCHGSHTNDKKKELSGRAVALRYSWDAKAKKFVRRPGVEKLILVVDGTWRREDLLTLARAGWDEIFYPDEMDKLAKAIV
jgi:hypothetical protein